MIITQPRNGHILKELMESAHDWKRPTAIRYPNLPTDISTFPVKRREVGKAELVSKGEEILLLPLGTMCAIALEAKEQLKEKEINPTILDPVFIKPLDKKTLNNYFKNTFYCGNYRRT